MKMLTFFLIKKFPNKLLYKFSRNSISNDTELIDLIANQLEERDNLLLRRKNSSTSRLSVLDSISEITLRGLKRLVYTDLKKKKVFDIQSNKDFKLKIGNIQGLSKTAFLMQSFIRAYLELLLKEFGIIQATGNMGEQGNITNKNLVLNRKQSLMDGEKLNFGDKDVYLADPLGGIFTTCPQKRRDYFGYKTSLMENLWNLSLQSKINLFKKNSIESKKQ